MISVRRTQHSVDMLLQKRWQPMAWGHVAGDVSRETSPFSGHHHHNPHERHSNPFVLICKKQLRSRMSARHICVENTVVTRSPAKNTFGDTFASAELLFSRIEQKTHTPTLRIVAPVMGGLFHPRQERSSPQSLYFGALRFRWAITIIENAKQQTIIKKDVTWTPQICRVFSQKERSVLDFLLNFIHHDFVQFGKQHSRYKAILPSIVLSQQCCDAYFIYLTVAKPLWDLTTKFYWNRPPPWTYWLEPPLSKQNLACK